MSIKQKSFLLEDTTYQKKKRKTGFIEFTVGMFLMVGFLVSFMILLQNLSSMWILFVVGIASLAILNFVHDWERAELVSGVAILGAAVLLFALNGAGVFRGFIYMMNQFITAWNTKYDSYTSLFQLSSISDWDRLFFGVLFVLVVAFILDKMIHKRSIVLLTLFVFTILYGTLILGLHQGIGGVLFLAIGWLLFWMMDILVHQTTLKSVVVLGLLFVVMTGISFATRSYTSNDTVLDLKNTIIAKIDEMRYGSDNLPKGMMKDASVMMSETDTQRLQISFESAQEMYLRGFVGSEYDGKEWTPLNEGAYVTDTSAGMLDWLESQGFSSVNQYVAYKSAQNGEAPTTSSFTVDDIGAYRKYLYVPYETESLKNGNSKKMFDWQYQSSGLLGVKNYDFTSAPTEVQNELLSVAGRLNAEATNYVDAETVYRSFVYDNYLTINDDLKTKLQETFFAGQEEANTGVSGVTNQIRIVLQQLTQYSETPYEYTENGDFITWFLDQEKLGNTSYYATAATMAYRAAGIPARYVEGYYLSSSDAQTLNNTGEKTTILNGGNAHAWTEVYMDEIGWMPVEVAPGFYFAEYTTQQILDAPQSSITVTNQQEQDELQGSTTDQLESQSDSKNKKDTAIQKTIEVLGMILLAAIILEALWLLIQLQQKIREDMYRKELAKGSNNRKASVLYDHICKIFQIDKVPGNSDFPYERSEEVGTRYESVDQNDYERVISLIQKSKFGETKLGDQELDTIHAFAHKVQEEGYEKCGKVKRMIRKYWYCI